MSIRLDHTHAGSWPAVVMQNDAMRVVVVPGDWWKDHLARVAPHKPRMVVEESAPTAEEAPGRCD